MMYRYDKLRGKIVEKYRSQKAFADILGCTKNTVTLKLQGERGFSQKDIEKWAKALDIQREDYYLYFFT